MAKIFYDRSGKAHVVGENRGNAAPEAKVKEKTSERDTPRAKKVSVVSEKVGTEKKAGKRNKNKGKRRVAAASPWREESEPKSSLSPKGAFAPVREGGAVPTASRGKKPFHQKDFRDKRVSGSVGSARKGAKPGTAEQSARREYPSAPPRADSSRGRGAPTGRGGSRADGRGGRGGGGRGTGGRGYEPKKFGAVDRNRKPSAPRKKREPDPSWIKLKGVVDKNKKGSAFLVLNRRDLEDIFIPRFYTDQLFHGDRVEAYLNDEGEIEDLKVLEHRFREIFGRVYLDDGHEQGREFKKTKSAGKTGYLIYERKRAREEVYIPAVPVGVSEGDWVKAEVNFGENGAVSATIIERIGPDLPAIYDIQMVAGEFNLKEHHTFDAVKQAESYRLEVPGKDEEGRTDLRHLPFITIDGERARDFDDAVYVENRGSNGYRLWVAIADVSHYVKIGTPLDDEAYARATSVYFPERAFHMLPRALSEELCSLKPNVPRLAMATSVDFSKEGVKGEIKMYDAIIESRRRCTYTEIEAEKSEPQHADLMALYHILKPLRHARGSIDFDFPEAEIILDEKTGEPSDIVVRERNDAHRLIEEFMIAANESVTEWMNARKLPFIYRIHEEPSPEAITKFSKLAKNMGMNFALKGGVPRPKILAEFIHHLKGHAAEPVLATALLRSMRQAIYSATFGEHYGLASSAYTHFTSPIRRYPDLIVHRLLRAALQREMRGEKRPSNEEIDKEQDRLGEMAEHCSYRERIATEAERESIRFKQVRLMGKHLGEQFEGKVNGLTERGMFVQLWHPYCEGMVTVDSMQDDFYEYIEDRMMLMGRKTRKTFTIGQKVKVLVVRVDLDTRRVEFELK